MAHGKVVIDEARCKGCTLCTTVCPRQIIRIDLLSLNDRGYHPAQLADPEERCTGCAMICPDACITVYRLASIAETRSSLGQRAAADG